MNSQSTGPPPLFTRLVVALIVLVVVALALVGVLYFLRRQRRAQEQALLPTHHRCASQRVTISTNSGFGRAESIYFVDEKRDLAQQDAMGDSQESPVPQIRITFPDDPDNTGKRQSGRVVVLRLSDSGAVGMEPVLDDTLPPYQKADAERFQSLDLDRIGGLKEKEIQRWS